MTNQTKKRIRKLSLSFMPALVIFISTMASADCYPRPDDGQYCCVASDKYPGVTRCCLYDKDGQRKKCTTSGGPGYSILENFTAVEDLETSSDENSNQDVANCTGHPSGFGHWVPVSKDSCTSDSSACYHRTWYEDRGCYEIHYRCKQLGSYARRRPGS